MVETKTPAELTEEDDFTGNFVWKRLAQERQEKQERRLMEYDTDKVDEMVLALLYLTSGANDCAFCAWKTHDWDAMDRLHEKGLIENTHNKNKSLLLTEEGFAQAKALFLKHFAKPRETDQKLE